MPDGGTTVIIQGRSRFRILSIVEEQPYFKAKIEIILDEEAPKDEDFAAYVSNIKDMAADIIDRKSTRLNSSHLVISYAVFCLKKKKKNKIIIMTTLTMQCCMRL